MARVGQTGWRPAHLGLLAVLCAPAGCQVFLDDADRQVYQLVDKRQEQAIGSDNRMRLVRPDGKASISQISKQDEAYQFVPHPIDSNVPESFRRTSTQPATTSAESSVEREIAAVGSSSSTVPAAEPAPLSALRPADKQWLTPELPSSRTSGPESLPADSAVPATAQPYAPPPGATVMSLSDALAYAFTHSWQFQTAKEQLYLAALDLTLERHLWTPRPFANVEGLYTDFGREFGLRDAEGNAPADRTMEVVAQAGIRQKLPYGGEIVARAIDTWIRDLTNRVTTGESGQLILEATIPLLRGAGPAAYESRYQAERDLIYAVRTFEGFRRRLAVDIAGEFFNLQQLRQQITNAEQSITALAREVGRSRALWESGRLIQLEVQRAQQDLLFAINRQVNAIQAYEAALDRFKIRIGMPVETPIDVTVPTDVTAGLPQTATQEGSLEAAIRMPEVTEDEAVRVALKYRLDLLNDLDRIGDADRGIAIAQNGLLPDLVATSSVLASTDPDKPSTLNYNASRMQWTAGVTLGVPLDRVEERNALRRSYILKDQARRNYEQAKDTVILQVRATMRRVRQQQEVLQIQIRNRDLALERVRSVQIRLATKGDISNREVVEAERDLLAARNGLAQAQADLYLAILEFRRDTGTLRVDDRGHWLGPDALATSAALSSSGIAP